MNVIIDFCVVPVGTGVSLSEYIAACQRVLRDQGFDPQLHPYGTIIEGEWDKCFRAVRDCHEAVHAMGAPRISTSIRVGTRSDRAQSAQDKVASVEGKLV